MAGMTDTDLDNVYTELCKTMTRIGEAGSRLFLARFALLAINAIGDAETSGRLVTEAGEGLTS